MRIILTIALCLALACPAMAGEIVWIDGCQWVVVSKDKDYFDGCGPTYGLNENPRPNSPVWVETSPPSKSFRCVELRTVAVWFDATHAFVPGTIVEYQKHNEPRFESFWAKPTGNCK